MVNECLYLFMKGNDIPLPKDWHDQFWYTILCFWLDQCGGGTSLLWYIRQVYNYVTLNSFLTYAEIINRELQIIFVLRTPQYHLPADSNPKRNHIVPTWEQILLSDCKIEHICNYSWACSFFMAENDISRSHHAMSHILTSPKGPIHLPKHRFTGQVLRGILSVKYKQVYDHI
jgi:hypothetical protein